MHIDAGMISQTGRHRDLNSDIARAWNKDKHDAAGGRLFMVVDGTGRADYGKVAAQLAATVIPKLYYKQMRANPSTPTRNALLNALHTANQHIYERAHALVSTGEMGTAVVIVVLRNQQVTIAWAGNCRVYLIPQENVEAQQLTRDHIVTREMSAAADTGKLLLPILGAAEKVRVGVRTVKMQIGDELVLCSDGVHQVIKPADMARLVRGRMSIQMAANDLVSTARDRDSYDNATALVVRLRGAEETVEPPEGDDAWGASHAEVTRLISNLNLTEDPLPDEEHDVTETKEIETVPAQDEDTSYFEGDSLESIYHDMVDDTELSQLPDNTAEQLRREQEAEFQAWFDNLSRDLRDKSEPRALEEIVAGADNALPDDSQEIVLGEDSDADNAETFDDLFADADAADVDDDVVVAGLKVDQDDDLPPPEPGFLAGLASTEADADEHVGDDVDDPPADDDVFARAATDASRHGGQQTASLYEPTPAFQRWGGGRLAAIRAPQKLDWLVIAGSVAVFVLALGILGGAFVFFAQNGGDATVSQLGANDKPSPALSVDVGKETPSPTMQPSPRPTEPPTLPPSTFSGVPNGWEAGTVLYVTRATGARRDVFSPPTNPNQYQPGDTVTITLARQRVGYREWYEYDGERWWFVDNIGWLAEDELSETP